MTHRNRLVPAAIVAGVVAISFAAIFFRKAAPTPPLVMSAVRLGIAAALLSPFVVRGWRRRTLPLGASLVAGLLYGLHFGFWVTSLTLTTVAASVTLVTATPLLLAVFAFVTGRDQPDRRHLWAIGLAVVGVTLIGGFDFGTSPEALAGDGLAFLGAAVMAGYLLLIRSQGHDLDVWALSGVACAVGSALLFASAALSGVPLTVGDDALVYLILAAVVPQVIGHGALSWSLRHVRPAVIGLATAGEPVGSTLLAWLWLGERVPPGTAVGCVVTIGAVLIAAWQPRPS
jgi:drug/metabolite transporter (DMT)-like permease